MASKTKHPLEQLHWALTVTHASASYVAARCDEYGMALAVAAYYDDPARPLYLDTTLEIISPAGNLIWAKVVPANCSIPRLDTPEER